MFVMQFSIHLNLKKRIVCPTEAFELFCLQGDNNIVDSSLTLKRRELHIRFHQADSFLEKANAELKTVHAMHCLYGSQVAV